jgi:hypothetical protein
MAERATVRARLCELLCEQLCEQLCAQLCERRDRASNCASKPMLKPSARNLSVRLQAHGNCASNCASGATVRATVRAARLCEQLCERRDRASDFLIVLSLCSVGSAAHAHACPRSLSFSLLHSRQQCCRALVQTGLVGPWFHLSLRPPLWVALSRSCLEGAAASHISTVADIAATDCLTTG